MRGTQHLQLTVYDARRRPLRRGWWSRWTLENVERRATVELHQEVASGWTRTGAAFRYVQFDFGAETRTSLDMITLEA